MCILGSQNHDPNGIIRQIPPSSKITRMGFQDPSCNRKHTKTRPFRLLNYPPDAMIGENSIDSRVDPPSVVFNQSLDATISRVIIINRIHAHDTSNIKISTDRIISTLFNLARLRCTIAKRNHAMLLHYK